MAQLISAKAAGTVIKEAEGKRLKAYKHSQINQQWLPLNPVKCDHIVNVITNSTNIARCLTK